MAREATIRTGPRPLPQHLLTAALTYASSNAALPFLRNGSASWNPALRVKAAELAADLEKADGKSLAEAVEREGRHRFDAFLAGVAGYRRHAHRRDVADPPPVWHEGSTRLLRYGAAGGRPVLVIPSLINRAYILDLSARRSFMRWLAERGFDGYLVDWGAPGEVERGFDLTDYIAGRLARAFETVRRTGGGPIAVIGYCMGGNLALALALRHQDDVAGLALLATPWDFHADRPDLAAALGAMGQSLAPQLALFGELATETLQFLFCALDPLLGWRKFIHFAGLDADSEAARDFVALEDWLNDGVPLAAAVARECLVDWYGENSTRLGQWRIDGEAIDPRRFQKPSLAVVPARDRIVPPGSARALADELANCETLTPHAGHIGMMAGGGAERVWRPLGDWLDQLGTP
jgi:polyhydroxyalkanoate synthase